MNKLTKTQYWQAHTSATKLLNDGCSAFEEGVAKLFFVCDLYNAAALVAAFPAIFPIEPAAAQFVVRAVYQDDPRAFANIVGRFDSKDAAKVAAAKFEDQEDAPNFMSCEIAEEINHD